MIPFRTTLLILTCFILMICNSMSVYAAQEVNGFSAQQKNTCPTQENDENSDQNVLSVVEEKDGHTLPEEIDSLVELQPMESIKAQSFHLSSHRNGKYRASKLQTFNPRNFISTPTLQQTESEEPEVENLLKFNPIKIFGLIHPTLELGWETKTTPRSTVQFMPAFILPINIYESNTQPIDVKSKVQGIRLSIEYKTYFKEEAFDGMYFGLELDYLNAKYTNQEFFEFFQLQSELPFLNTLSGNNVEEKTYDRKIFSLNGKLGYQKKFSNHLYIDAYIGLGFRRNNVTTNHKYKQKTDNSQPKTSSFDKKYWSVSAPLNIRLGLRL